MTEPNSYEAGNYFLNSLRSFLAAAGIDASKCRLVIELPDRDTQRQLVEVLQRDAVAAPPMSAARVGNHSGYWQGVEYEFSVKGWNTRHREQAEAGEAVPVAFMHETDDEKWLSFDQENPDCIDCAFKTTPLGKIAADKPAVPGREEIVRAVLPILRTYPGKPESHDDATARQAREITDAILALMGKQGEGDREG